MCFCWSCSGCNYRNLKSRIVIWDRSKKKVAISNLGFWCEPVDPCFGKAETLSDCASTALHIVVQWLRLLSRVSTGGTHHADHFLMPNISCKIWPTWSFAMHTFSSSSRTFNQRSANTRRWTFVSSVVKATSARCQSAPESSFFYNDVERKCGNFL